MHIQTNSQSKLLVTKGEREEGRGELGLWDQDLQMTIHKIEKQQGFTLWHRELYPLPYNNL